MSRKCSIIVSLCTACSLTVSLPGCSAVKHYTVGDPESPVEEATALPTDARSRQVYKMYKESIEWCQDKERSLLAANTGLNAGTDVLSLILSAIASVINPVATAHIFAGGATISTGLKTTVANDITSSALTNITIAFDKIYFEQMADLMTSIKGKTLTDFRCI